MNPKLYVTSKDGTFEEKDIFECPDLMPAAQNPDGSRVLHATNPGSDNVQVQISLDGKKYYVRLMANSLSSIVF